MSKISSKGGSAWQYTQKIYGGPGEQTFDKRFGNLIATHGGRRNRNRYGRGGSTRISTTGGKGKKKSNSRKSQKAKRGKKVTRGGCGCQGGTPPVVPPTTVSGGSAEPSSATSSLLTGSISA